MGGMVGLRRAVVRWGLRGIIGVWGVVFDELMGEVHLFSSWAVGQTNVELKNEPISCQP